jgi:hypothetical protein
MINKPFGKAGDILDHRNLPLTALKNGLKKIAKFIYQYYCKKLKGKIDEKTD